MNHSNLLLLAFLIGVVGGLRALTAPAVTSWAAHLGWINLAVSPLKFMSSMITVAFFTLLAIVELVTDQLPTTPARTKPAGLIPRVLLGALCGATITSSGQQSLALGAVVGAVGGIVGAFAGYQARTGLVKALGVPDYVIAVLEDALAISAAIFLLWRF
jgi:uncharacterized membrane protein